MTRYMKVKFPKDLDVNAIRQTIIQFMEKEGVAIKRSFDTTTSTWRHKVDFEPVVETPDSGLDGIFGIEVSTDDELYYLVNGGAKAHWLEPVNAKALRFPRAFLPKSIPGLIRANPGYRSPNFQFSKGFVHPGFPARKFDEAVRKDFEPKFKKDVKELMKTLRQVSGLKA